jgi:hypothetical protein
MFTLVAVTAILAAAAGYLAARGRGSGPDQGDKDPKKPRKLPSGGRAGAEPGAGKAAPSPSPFEGMPLALGDVVLAEAEERWLAGALVARENGRVVAALFFSPEGASTRSVAAFPAPRRDIYWMSPVEVVVPAEPPATLEIGEAMLTRRGRLPVSLERVGQGAPHVDETQLWATYEGGGRDVAVVLAGGGKVLAWRGSRLDEGDYDRLGAGGPADE